MDEFDRGDRLRIGNQTGGTRAAFTDINGTAADPTTVLLTLRQPDGTLQHYGWPLTAADGLLTRETLARFYRDVTVDQSGYWDWRLASTGDPETAEEGRFWVRPSAVLA